MYQLFVFSYFPDDIVESHITQLKEFMNTIVGYSNEQRYRKSRALVAHSAYCTPGLIMICSRNVPSEKDIAKITERSKKLQYALEKVENVLNNFEERKIVFIWMNAIDKLKSLVHCILELISQDNSVMTMELYEELDLKAFGVPFQNTFLGVQMQKNMIILNIHEKVMSKPIYHELRIRGLKNKKGYEMVIPKNLIGRPLYYNADTKLVMTVPPIFDKHQELLEHMFLPAIPCVYNIFSSDVLPSDCKFNFNSTFELRQLTTNNMTEMSDGSNLSEINIEQIDMHNILIHEYFNLTIYQQCDNSLPRLIHVITPVHIFFQDCLLIIQNKKYSADAIVEVGKSIVISRLPRDVNDAAQLLMSTFPELEDLPIENLEAREIIENNKKNSFSVNFALILWITIGIVVLVAILLVFCFCRAISPF